jgi:hypothetical protein
MLHPHEQRLGVRMRWESSIDPAVQPVEVEQHVDRGDEHHHRSKEKLPTEIAAPLDEVDDLPGVLVTSSLWICCTQRMPRSAP